MADHDTCETSTIVANERYISSIYSPKHQREDIRQYVELEADDGKVLHVEKVTSRVVYGQRYDVFDVHTETTRWWAITNLNNIYEQTMFPSMDMCLTFHIGFMLRMLETDAQPDAVGEVLLKTRRRIQGAADALDDATEVEDFQAVGLQLREALLCLSREIADVKLVPSGIDPPKGADFVHWSEYIINRLTPNSHLGRVRATLKNLAKGVWQVVNGLTHTTSADKVLASISVDLTRCLWDEVATLVRALDEEPKERCPSCESFQLFNEYRREPAHGVYEFKLCEVCGWKRPIENNDDARSEPVTNSSPHQ